MPLRSPLVSAAAPWNFLSRRKRSPRAFTLIELLIVVAIIAILAAIAAPNYLEAQMRAKVSRVESDLRTMTTGLESFRIDFNTYPEGTDDASRMPAPVVQELDALAPGYYTFASLGPNGEPAGGGFPTLTTPVAYLSNAFIDPFAGTKNPFLTYCYRNAKDRKNGYIITSFGPDADLLSQEGGGPRQRHPQRQPPGHFPGHKKPVPMRGHQRARRHPLHGRHERLGRGRGER
jgi:prepilin-type N-terminal cleavage/methylation domain-containing protein